MIDYVVVPVASWYGLTSEYRYLKKSIKGYLTGVFFIIVSRFSLLVPGSIYCI